MQMELALLYEPVGSQMEDPRHVVTPPDLLEAGWVIEPFFDYPNRWVGRKSNAAGGAEYSPPCSDLESLYHFIRHNRINLLPWLEGFGKEWTN